MQDKGEKYKMGWARFGQITHINYYPGVSRYVSRAESVSDDDDIIIQRHPKPFVENETDG